MFNEFIPSLSRWLTFCRIFKHKFNINYVQGSSMLNGAGSNYKCITNATVSPAQNGSGTANGNTHAHEVSF